MLPNSNMNPELEARRAELIELAKIEYPDNPDFFIQMCVDAYIREHEPHLLDEEELAPCPFEKGGEPPTQ